MTHKRTIKHDSSAWMKSEIAKMKAEDTDTLVRMFEYGAKVKPAKKTTKESSSS